MLKDLEQYNVEIVESKEKYGTLNVSAYSKNNSEEVQNIIDKYEEKTEQICELCGNNGTMTTIYG